MEAFFKVQAKEVLLGQTILFNKKNIEAIKIVVFLENAEIWQNILTKEANFLKEIIVVNKIFIRFMASQANLIWKAFTVSKEVTFFT